MKADFLCVLETKSTDSHWIRWLNEKKERRIVFINAPDRFDHPQVKYKEIDSPLQIEPLAKEVAKEAVFLTLEIIGNGWERFRKELERAHREANLLLSDASDWGCTLAKHFFAMRNFPLRDGLKLREAFSNIPAIIVGAGPSLEKNGHLLEHFKRGP